MIVLFNRSSSPAVMVCAVVSLVAGTALGAVGSADSADGDDTKEHQNRDQARKPHGHELTGAGVIK